MTSDPNGWFLLVKDRYISNVSVKSCQKIWQSDTESQSSFANGESPCVGFCLFPGSGLALGLLHRPTCDQLLTNSKLSSPHVRHQNNHYPVVNYYLDHMVLHKCHLLHKATTHHKSENPRNCCSVGCGCCVVTTHDTTLPHSPIMCWLSFCNAIAIVRGKCCVVSHNTTLPPKTCAQRIRSWFVLERQHENMTEKIFEYMNALWGISPHIYTTISENAQYFCCCSLHILWAQVFGGSVIVLWLTTQHFPRTIALQKLSQHISGGVWECCVVTTQHPHPTEQQLRGFSLLWCVVALCKRWHLCGTIPISVVICCTSFDFAAQANRRTECLLE